MYENYGDKNFFEYGRLVEVVNDNEFNIICCTPYDDEEDKYQFAECVVDITDSWIDRKAVMEYGGMTEDNFNAIHFAIDCISYYGVENFGGMSYAYDYRNMNEADIKEILKHRLIANDNLDITW